ncbi:MAG TPA: pentapeptide repeat-containing protein [Kofleriaceae bacterium]|nr:pentapeptide repeat-containing protein [Kofleriaceae bacterium]
MAGEPPRFGDDEPAVTILHVSDMQFGKHHRFADEGGGFDTLLRRLCDDLDLLRDQNGLKPDLIALTGDLAEWGMKREFEQVAAFAEGLLAHLKLAPDRLLVVPGNHDINRNLCEAYVLRCAGEGDDPKRPYWPKWEPYIALIGRLYRDIDRYRFTELEPWTLFEIPALKVVVAGMNSTIHESHLDADHHGFVGEPQLRWFASRLAEYERKGWLRVGLVHHNAVRRAALDDENLQDADDLREILGDRLHVLLHGHTHQGRVEMLGPSLPVISTGSAAVRRDQRPGPSQDQPGETPNQYQIVRITRGGLWCAAREYTYERKRWVGDTRVSKHGDRWWHSLDRAWPTAEATFPPAAPTAHRRDSHATSDDDHGAERREMRSIHRQPEDDLLDDVIGWCRIRGAGKIAEVTRVRHRGPWGDYAKVHDLERGIGLLGAYGGDLTAEVLDRWIADVHDPFRGRGQLVSRLVVATSAIDPTLRSAAQVRGVDLERLIDYQRVLDTAGYSEKLRERLAKDREYPSGYYLEQEVTVWSPIVASTARVERAADWLTARLLEREGTFAVVLGPAGVGKTFLLREVARRLGKQQAITPILVELRDLERAHTIEELAATQFTRFGVPWHPRAFRRDLEEGRLALLFDGFDELALRVRSAAIPAHFERIYAAAVDRARIVLSSRTEHFLSSGQVADLMSPSSAGMTPLGGLLERVQRRLVLEVHPFEREDVAAYLRQRFGAEAGEARLARLARVHDLVGLACNPRMLGFIVDLPEDKLAQAAGLGGSLTSDALYRLVVDDAWLAAEAKRLKPPGAAPGPSAETLRDAATNLALQLWRDPGGSIQAEDVGVHAGELLARMCDSDPEWTTHTARARTLLTRDDRGRISFIHQTVLEWLVAGRLAGEITGDVPGSHLEVGRLNAFMIDLLRERLGDEVLARWAEDRLAAPTTNAAAEHAREVLKRLNREATTQAILRDQDLRGQEFGGQRLSRAVLDGSDLTGARMVGRDLTGASLVGAKLAYADFTDACLRDADLTDANLAFARFHRADLGGARLTGACLTGASFLGARAVPALDKASAIGVALAPSAVEAMYTRATWGGCRVVISPDGTLVASGHDDGTVRLWDCARGQLVRILAGHGGSVWSVVFSPDSKTVASSEDDTVRLWNTADGSERARLAGHRGSVWSVAFSPNSKLLASAADETVRLWNATAGYERARLAGHLGRVRSVAFSPDGKLVASGADDATVRLWNAGDGSEQTCLTGHRGSVSSVTFSPDGKTAASGADDATVRLWNTGDGSERARLAGHGRRVSSVVFSPDGKTVASSADDATVRLWNVEDGSERMRLAGHGRRIQSVAFSLDGKTVASGADDATVRLWNVVDGTERARLADHRGRVWSVAFSPDGKTVASGADEFTVRLWNVEDGSERARLSGHRGNVFSVAFSPDGKTMASGADDATVRLWNADGSERARLAGNHGSIWSVVFSPDGKLVASASDNGEVTLWNVEDESEQARLAANSESVWSVAFSPNGKTIASGADDNTLRLWNAADGKARACLVGHRGCVLSVAFSPDGKTVASGAADATVRLWNAENGRERARMAGHRGSVLSVAFSPDSTTVASGAADATIRLWNAEDGSERARLAGHEGSVRSVAFSLDGTMLASGAADATVRLWDVASGRCLAILYGTASGSVAARPDGRYRVRGDVAGQFWHVIGLHRYDIGELDALVPGLRLADDEPLYTQP